MVIEDDLLLDDAYRKHYGAKYDLRIATDGESAMKEMALWRPDLILLDLYLPGEMAGIDVLRAVKKNMDLADVPVIVVTNLPDMEEKVLDAGAAKCIMKTELDLNKLDFEILEVIGKE